ncbi:hypothetical protein Tco_0665856 [Tanacetum coccineum]
MPLEATYVEKVSLEEKNEDCRDFFNCLKESLAFWDTRLPIDARIVYAKMAEEISDLLVADSGEGLNKGQVRLLQYHIRFPHPRRPSFMPFTVCSITLSHFTLYLAEAAS